MINIKITPASVIRFVIWFSLSAVLSANGMGIFTWGYWVALLLIFALVMMRDVE
jgi:hypothetical protein